MHDLSNARSNAPSIALRTCTNGRTDERTLEALPLAMRHDTSVTRAHTGTIDDEETR